MLKRRVLRVFPLVLLATLLTGAVQAQDPNLIGWWTFDEGAGTIAHDSSGHGYDGTVTDAQWAEGVHGGAMNFDAVGYVDAPPAAWATISKQVTVAFWAYGNPAIQPQANFTFGAFIDPADNNARVASCHVPWSDGTVYWDTSGVTGAWSPDRINKAASATEYEGQWRHWAFVKNVNTGTQSIYLNGALWHTMTGMTQLMAGNKVTGFTIGDRPAHDSPYGGMMDDFRLYNRALTNAEIKKLALRPKAYGPTPRDGATGFTLSMLTWTPGDMGVFDALYLGSSPDFTTAKPVSTQSVTKKMYLLPATMEPGQTYYWRIDSLDKNKTLVATGDVWSFTTAPATAFAPSPRDGDKWIDPNADLSWQAGQDAMEHALYFGTDKAAVEARDASVSKGTMYELTFDLGTLALRTTYYWVVDETDTGYPGQVWSFTTTGGGGGAKGEYFANSSRNVVGAPALTRIDPAINFSWGNDGPGSPVGADYFSARWTADLEIAIADAYTFIGTSDDGIRVWLNDNLIVDAWVDRGTADTLSRPQQLNPGVYSLRVEYYEWGGGAAAQLSWETPTMARQIIPAGPLQPPVRARPIYPKDGDVNIPQDLTLMWSTGEKAVTHDVYLGTDKAAVEAATPADGAIYKGSQANDESTLVPGALEWNKTYYWRIDEVNTANADSPWKGSVWSFTTADFIVVDDFESYNNDLTNRIFQTWIDGWGYTEPAPGNPGNSTSSTVGYSDPALPFAERSIIHGGIQSMPLDYNNIISPYYSETDRTWNNGQNWTLNNVNTLSLWFRGYPVKYLDDGATITISAAGDDIWNAADAFRFACKKLNGDGSITAKVNSIVQTDVWAKAGVMVRETLTPGSANAALVVSAASGVSFQWRPFTDDVSANVGQSGLKAPYWVRLTRTGNTFKAEASADGKTWSSVGADAAASSHDVTMGGNVYIGLCVTSHNTNAKIATTGVFSDIKTAGGVTGTWQVADIGSIKHPGNEPGQMYVALQDSAGKIAVVNHDDANAVLKTEWTECQIPLSKFTGVNTKSIKKMYIGVGDRKAPQAGGHGMLFIDDIRVIK